MVCPTSTCHKFWPKKKMTSLDVTSLDGNWIRGNHPCSSPRYPFSGYIHWILGYSGHWARPIQFPWSPPWNPPLIHDAHLPHLIPGQIQWPALWPRNTRITRWSWCGPHRPPQVAFPWHGMRSGEATSGCKSAGNYAIQSAMLCYFMLFWSSYFVYQLVIMLCY